VVASDPAPGAKGSTSSTGTEGSGSAQAVG
jgi:hypothetical protein